MEQISEFEFYARLREQSGMVLLLFTAPACASCRAFKGLLREYEMLRDDFQVWEADAVENPGLVREYEVFHLPALFLFQDGHYWRPIVCEARPAALHQAVTEALALPPLEPP